MVGGGGDVQILNKYDSWISFLSSVRYWMAFNIEGPVSLILGVSVH